MGVVGSKTARRRDLLLVGSFRVQTVTSNYHVGAGWVQRSPPRAQFALDAPLGGVHSLHCLALGCSLDFILEVLGGLNAENRIR